MEGNGTNVFQKDYVTVKGYLVVFMVKESIGFLLFYVDLSGWIQFFGHAYQTVYLKDTCYVWGKKQQNLQLLDVLACNSANN